METSFEEENQGMHEEDNKYLVFRLADELYGAPLVSIREISRVSAITAVPFMAKYFKGIINLRGQIISVVDMRIKFDLLVPESQDGILIIIDSEGGPIAAIVDDVVSVSEFPPDDVEGNLALKTKIPLQFFLGIGKIDNRLVNLIDIGGTLNSDDFAIVRRVASTQVKGMGIA